MTLLPLEQVLAKTALRKRLLYRLIACDQFPRQVKISEGRSAWVEAEVEAWIEQRVQARDASKAAGAEVRA